MNALAEVLGESPAIVALRDAARQALARQAGSARPSPILILGETGVGKGLFAQAIHRAGPRADRPFVDVNCAAIPETLLESELFGFERGAFTDARQAKLGLFQAAHRGTLFLDEIGSLPGALQGKLLKVLEERMVRRLGSTRTEAVDVWVLAATNQDLKAAAAARRFRQDLYYRLAVLTFRLPPLRERGEDVLLLARHLLAGACADAGTPPKSLTPDACAALLAYSWPGNVRELGNVMRRVAMLSQAEVVTAKDIELPRAEGRARRKTPPEATTSEEAKLGEAERFLAVLRRTDWNLSRAAAALGMPRNTLRYRIDKHGLRPDEGPRAPEPEQPAATSGSELTGPVPNNLPEQLTSFVGRAREIAELKRALVTTRLLTLTGTGGSGKTRLAVETATALLPEFPDGVWLVELAALTQPVLVPGAVASALRVREEAKQPLLDALIAFVRSKRLLLVLDNCEHLILACARLVQRLLQSSGSLRIMATSREPFGIAGETVWIVPPLSFAPSTLAPSVEMLSQYEAVRLFIDRARTVQPNFALTDGNAPAVSEVCRRLDGIPLALELAAARVKLLTVEQISGRLNDRFRLLTGGSRVVPPRQQTLRAAMDWSYDLLSDAERLLLQRLSVFAGGFSLEAAELVCSGRGMKEHEILDMLSQLVDKSLVISEVQAGEARYRLLETIWEYTREKVVQSSTEVRELRVRHHDCYLKLAERAEAGFLGVDQTVWLDRLEADHDNLRAALSWRESGAEGRLRLAAALWRFWEVRGRQREGRNWLEDILSEGGGEPPVVRAKALNGVGNLARDQGDYDKAAMHHREALALRREFGDRRGIAVSLNNLGVVAHDQGDYEAARALYEQAMPLWKAVRDTFGVALTLNNLGRAWRFTADYARAATLCQESLETFRAIGHKWGIARALNSFADLAHCQDDRGRARALYEESLALRREVDDKLGIAVSLNNLGRLAVRGGELQRAMMLCEEGLSLRRDLGDRRGIAVSLHSLGIIAMRRGDVERSAVLNRESLALRRDMGDKIGIACCLEAVAALATAVGHPEEAARLLGAAQSMRDAIKAPLPPVDRSDHERTVASIRAATNEEAFARAWAEGRTATLEDSLAHALAEPPAAGSRSAATVREPHEPGNRSSLSSREPRLTLPDASDSR